ncbi:hypothetical protein TNCT_697221 [Trichonephila clavata]|uniref:Uncharacterized protein n=1 Tax=Trichonephila clavata TaxID=2740835 RepID=A0A8X6JN80_TRICU|nr:hypothetical protein TNCT_697221 [Trichonephila clavata]
MNNPNNEGNCSMEQENGDDISDPPTYTNPLPPDVHCVHIRTLQKQIRHAESRIRHQQELIDIETFDQRDTAAAQLQSYIHAKGAAELDYNVKMGHQRSARESGSEPAIKRSEPDSATKTQNSSCSEIILAIREFQNFFSNHPELLTLGKALRSASSEEDKLDIFYDAMASTSNLSI